MRTTPTPDQEFIVVERRRTVLLPTDALLAVTRAFINPAVSHARLGRGLYAYLATLDPNEPPQRDKFNAAYGYLTTNSFLMPRLGRYEGFKSSSKLTNIENDALLENIIEMYEYALPKAALSSNRWNENHRKLQQFAEQATAEDNSLTARYKMVSSAAGKRHLERMVTIPQLYTRHQTLVTVGKAIIADIDKAYPEQTNAASAHSPNALLDKAARRPVQ